jgi:hypothetical protein
MSPFDRKPLPGGKPVAGPREKKLAIGVAGIAAVAAMLAGPVASSIFPQPQQNATGVAAADVVHGSGADIGPLLAGRRTLAFDDAGVRRTLMLERPRGTAGPVLFDDAFYAAQERSSPAFGRWIAKDGDRYRLIDVDAGAGNRSARIEVGPPETVDALLARLTTGTPGYVPAPASFR